MIDTWVTPYIPLQDKHPYANYKLFKELFFKINAIKSSILEDSLTKRHWYTLYYFTKETLCEKQGPRYCFDSLKKESLVILFASLHSLEL